MAKDHHGQHFYLHSVLIDSIAKKIKVASEVSSAIGLKNIAFKHERVQEEKAKFDFVVSRAVMPLDDLVKLVKKNISSEQRNAVPNGLICLKGGELEAEIANYKKIVEVTAISNYYEEEFYKTKKIVYVPL